MEDLLCLHGASPGRLPSANMNEHLTERLGRGNAVREPSTIPSQPSNGPEQTLNLRIRGYSKMADEHDNAPDWTQLPEIPTAKEVFDKGGTDHAEPIQLEENTVVGPYTSKDDYLRTHYLLLREDAVAPLRDVISEIQEYPSILEQESDNNAFIYERV